MPDALFFDLYLSTLGGGERVVLELADVAAETMAVTVAGPTIPTPSQLDALGMRPAAPVQWRRMHPAAFPTASREFDLVVYLANGVPLPHLASRGIAIVQFPMRSLGGGGLRRRLQDRLLDRYELVAYSQFVDGWIGERWGRHATVLHPPVTLGRHDPARKRPLILSVGRFFDVQHVKRHDVLIEAFSKVHEALPEWRLALVGSVSSAGGTAAYVDGLRRRAEGLPVDFHFDASPDQLEDLRAEASLYWHAGGYGRSADAPERAEHFGIATAEAMSWGAVPIVYDDGGSPEVVGNAGVLWRTVAQLEQTSIDLARNGARLTSMAEAAVAAVERFGTARFRAEARALLARPPAAEPRAR